MNLSKQAQEVLTILEEVRVHPLTETLLEEYEGRRYLQMDNICNGHVENVPQEYTDLMLRLNETLCGNLITNQGQHSGTFYELRKAGYSLRTGEQDSFGPLSSVISCPNGNWVVCYG